MIKNLIKFKGVFGVLALCIGLSVLQSCSDDGSSPEPVSILAAPSEVNVQFTSNSTADISFDKVAATQTNFKIRLTDQYDQAIEYDDVETAPVSISSFPKGEIYTVEMAAGSSTAIGEYGEKSAPLLASVNSDVNMDRIKMFRLINAARAEARVCGSDNMPAVEPLHWDDKLEQAARIHTVDMEKNGFFSHTSASDNSSPGDRISRTGYSWSIYGENIANGYATEEAAMEGWLSSPGHCKNIMSSSVTEMGVYREGNKWTQVFANPQ